MATPATFEELQQLVFATCEEFIHAARHVARLQDVSLTIVHKTRNVPGNPQSQYRGSIVMCCVEHLKKNCTFELKGYGPVEGGWRMRPLQYVGMKRHTVTSWCVCDHVKTPQTMPIVSLVTSWKQLSEIPFPSPDLFIDAAHSVSRRISPPVQLTLTSLMISDGKPKPNGRNSTYIPRGFLNLDCVVGDCPMTVKAREEDAGWVMRPWKERGRREINKTIKGAASQIQCMHDVPDSLPVKKKKTKRADSTPPVQNQSAIQVNNPLDLQDGFDAHLIHGLSASSLIPELDGSVNTSFLDSLHQQDLSLSHLQLQPTSHKRARSDSSSTDFEQPPVKKLSLPPAQNASLEIQWSFFLTKLDPTKRLLPLLDSVVEGGIDPGAVISWPNKEVKDYLELICPRDKAHQSISEGLRFQFRIKVIEEGEKVWREVLRDLEGEHDELQE